MDSRSGLYFWMQKSQNIPATLTPHTCVHAHAPGKPAYDYSLISVIPTSITHPPDEHMCVYNPIKNPHSPYLPLPRPPLRIHLKVQSGPFPKPTRIPRPFALRHFYPRPNCRSVSPRGFPTPAPHASPSLFRPAPK